VDFRLFRDGAAAAWYAVLGAALLAAPAILPPYYLSQLVLVGIFTIAGAGLMLLCGYCGQISLGHSAFLAVGAFTAVVLERHGVPFLPAFLAAGLISTVAGLAVGLAARRLSGMYFAIATLAAAFIVNEIIVRWQSVTNGASGLSVPRIRILGFVADTEPRLYAIVLLVALGAMLVVRNIVRAPLGLAMMAIRDSETAAQSLGVPLTRVKLTAFGLSALFTGIAGALYAHAIQFIDPDQFTIVVSIELLVMIFIGGIGSMHGIVLGAVFIIVLPQLVAVAKDLLPPAVAQQTGLQAAVYGAVLLLFILVEPSGLFGIWRRIKRYCSLFPFYRRGSLKRARRFSKSETW
jgi:branched-chain amino acid transport system permease protein